MAMLVGLNVNVDSVADDVCSHGWGLGIRMVIRHAQRAREVVMREKLLRANDNGDSDYKSWRGSVISCLCT